MPGDGAWVRGFEGEERRDGGGNGSVSAGYPCPWCGTQLVWVAQYAQWYCGRCQRYVPPAPQPAPTLGDEIERFFASIDGPTTRCPWCGRGAMWVSQYGRWYCNTCQRWL